MLKEGDFFTQGGLTYKVIGKDAQGRAISTLCEAEPVSPDDEVEEIEEIEETPVEEPKQESLIDDQPKKHGRK